MKTTMNAEKNCLRAGAREKPKASVTDYVTLVLGRMQEGFPREHH